MYKGGATQAFAELRQLLDLSDYSLEARAAGSAKVSAACPPLRRGRSGSIRYRAVSERLRMRRLAGLHAHADAAGRTPGHQKSPGNPKISKALDGGRGKD